MTLYQGLKIKLLSGHYFQKIKGDSHVVVPTAAHWSEKYNNVVVSAAEQGYVVSNYLPLVPPEKIAKVFGENGKGPETVETAG